MNLFLAAIWFAMGIGLTINPDWMPRGFSHINLLAFVLGIYNLVRWWVFRSARSLRDQSSVMYRRRPLRRPGDDVEPDPTFQFTPQPTPPPSDGPPVPSANGHGPEKPGESERNHP